MTQPIIARFKLDYDNFKLDIDLALPSTGITILFGPSGSGKSIRLQNMILDLYDKCFKRIYIFSKLI